MVYLVPILAFVIALIAGTLALRAGRGWIAAVAAALLAALMGWAIWQGRQHQGWDALGYAILAMLVVAPGLLGLLTGSVLGWWQARRARARG